MKASECIGQTRIPMHFKILNQIELVLAKNKHLTSTIQNLLSVDNNDHPSDHQNASQDVHSSSQILQAIINTAEANSNKKKQGHRYDQTIKTFASYIRMLSGPLAYETLYANLSNALPSLSTTNRYIKDNGPNLAEGVFRYNQLQQYLTERKLSLNVWLSEDATRITGRVQYDPTTNQLVGFVLPLDDSGMPIPFSFAAKNPKDIESHFLKQTTAQLIYAVMAQPLSENVPAFCLALFSTDNKFTSLQVFNRWKHIQRELSKLNISILGVSSDGDSKLLKAMKMETGIARNMLSPFDCSWIMCNTSGLICIQDTTHIITKMRNWLLKCSVIHPIGENVITSSHLKYLIANVSKDKHCLTPSDIEPKDRQNFKSAEKISSLQVTTLLEEHVPDSKGILLILF